MEFFYFQGHLVLQHHQPIAIYCTLGLLPPDDPQLPEPLRRPPLNRLQAPLTLFKDLPQGLKTSLLQPPTRNCDCLRCRIRNLLRPPLPTGLHLRRYQDDTYVFPPRYFPPIESPLLIRHGGFVEKPEMGTRLLQTRPFRGDPYVVLLRNGLDHLLYHNTSLEQEFFSRP